VPPPPKPAPAAVAPPPKAAPMPEQPAPPKMAQVATSAAAASSNSAKSRQPNPNTPPNKYNSVEQPMPKLNNDDDTGDTFVMQSSFDQPQASNDSITSNQYKPYDPSAATAGPAKPNGNYLTNNRNDDNQVVQPKRSFFKSIVCEIL
jgi:hypothetical protein